MRTAALLVAVLAGCPSRSAPTAEPPPPAPDAARPADAARPPAADAAADPCGATADARGRDDQAEPVDRALDLDGDGVADPVFRGGCPGIHGNCSFLVYRCAPSGAVFLGELVGFRFDGPRCAEPPVAGTPCRLSIDRRMHHDDYQEELYDLTDGQYVRTGSGRYIAPRKRP
jgi:hypothetical protein